MFFRLAYHATGDATAFAVDTDNDESGDCTIHAGQTGGVAGKHFAAFKRPVDVKVFVHAMNKSQRERKIYRQADQAGV
jgi:hypothetical protein